LVLGTKDVNTHFTLSAVLNKAGSGLWLESTDFESLATFEPEPPPEPTDSELGLLDALSAVLSKMFFHAVDIEPGNEGSSFPKVSPPDFLVLVALRVLPPNPPVDLNSPPLKIVGTFSPSWGLVFAASEPGLVIGPHKGIWPALSGNLKRGSPAEGFVLECFGELGGLPFW
jgi:hypothetical protein